MNIHAFPTPPTNPPKLPEPKKQRTITLTNRRPIKIIESDWPEIAEAVIADDDPFNNGCPYGWSMTMKVRRHIDHDKNDNFFGPVREYLPCYIIHATYSMRDEINEEDYIRNQTVRVGRMLTGKESECLGDLEKHISAIGDELRERIRSDDTRKFVVNLIDKIFAELEPYTVT